MVEFDVNKLREQIESLKDLPNIKEVIQLRKRLRKELANIGKPTVTKPTVDKIVIANVKRSSKLRNYHRYMRLIQDNFPELPYNQIRKEFAKRKQGFESDIPDAVWQNPSP